MIYNYEKFLEYYDQYNMIASEKINKTEKFIVSENDIKKGCDLCLKDHDLTVFSFFLSDFPYSKHKEYYTKEVDIKNGYLSRNDLTKIGFKKLSDVSYTYFHNYIMNETTLTEWLQKSEYHFVYRGLFIKKDIAKFQNDLIKRNSVGMNWAYNIDGSLFVIDHDDEGLDTDENVVIFLKAKLYGDEIDYPATYYCNFNIREEYEIRLKKNSLVEILGYHKDGVYTRFKNKLYVKA